MRKTIYAIISFLAVPFLFFSCLDNNDTTYEFSSDALISAFSINNIETKVPSKTATGKDTTLIVTTIGSNYSFTIDQNENRIYNSDSLPAGTDITKVTLNLSIVGYAVVYEKNQQDTIWTNTDSLDFTKPVNLKVYAYDGTTRSYKAQINVHKQDPDFLQWTQLENTDFNVNAAYRQKAVSYNNRIYVFAEGANQVQVTSTEMTNGRSWTPLQDITGIPVTADYSSVIAFKGSNEEEKLYLLAQNELYVSSDGTNWSKVDTNRTFTQLFASSSTHLYGISDQKIVESENALAWTEQGDVTAYFPTETVSYTVCKLATNSQIERLVVVGERNVESDTTAVVWSKLSNESKWTPLLQQEDNPYGCPKLKELAVIHYDDDLYAFGGVKDFTTTLPVKAFGDLYQSVDHGMTWKTTRKIMLPEEFIDKTSHFSYVVDTDNYIWIMWSGSNDVWKGRINRLGFVKK